MSAFGQPIAVALILGVVGGAVVVVVNLMRLSVRRSPRAHVAQVQPDRRAQRLDDVVASSPALRRAVALTTNLASRRGALGSVERSLRAADVPVRPAEMILAHVGGIGVVPAMGYLLTRSVPVTLLGLVVAVFGPMLAVRFIGARRRKRFGKQLPDALTALAGSLRAGRSVGQAIEALSQELVDPMGRELRKVVAEARLGRSLQEALADASKRIDSADFRWVVLAMQIQSEVGGNLAELLDQVAATTRERARMKGEVKALTAEGRASAMMLAILVPGLGAVMAVINPSYMAPLFSTSIGRILVGISTVMIVSGSIWMNSMVKIDV